MANWWDEYPVAGQNRLPPASAPVAIPLPPSPQRALENQRQDRRDALAVTESARADRTQALAAQAAERAQAAFDISNQMAQQKLAAEQEQASAKKTNAMESSRNLMGALSRASKFVSGSSTGVPGAILRHVPATDASKLETIVDQEVRGNIFRNWVDSMKAVSDSGTTGIGRILQTEIPLVTGAQGALDPVNMGADETMNSIGKIARTVTRTAAITAGENPDDPAVFSKYWHKLHGAPDDPKDVAAQGIKNAYKQYTAMTAKLPPAARQAGLGKLNASPDMKRLFDIVNAGGKLPRTAAQGSSDDDALLRKYGVQ